VALANILLFRINHLRGLCWQIAERQEVIEAGLRYEFAMSSRSCHHATKHLRLFNDFLERIVSVPRSTFESQPGCGSTASIPKGSPLSQRNVTVVAVSTHGVSRKEDWFETQG
jgi:hypothetical protein